LTSRNTPGILSEEEPRTFWISWEKGVLAFGYGQEMHQYPLLKWNMDKKIKINHIGFATILGTTGQFRVWNYNDEAGFSQVLHLETPISMISGSESGTLVVTGGLNFPFFVHSEPKFSSRYARPLFFLFFWRVKSQTGYTQHARFEQSEEAIDFTMKSVFYNFFLFEPP